MSDRFPPEMLRKLRNEIPISLVIKEFLKIPTKLSKVCLKEGNMSDRFPPEMLRRLRNEIPINLVIKEFLKIPTKLSEGYFRFLCPLCSEFITATNPKTNLARCFLCEKNFNAIDIVMTAKQVSFRSAVDYLVSIKSIKSI